MRSIPGRSVLYGTAAVVALGFSGQWLQAQDEAPMAASPSPPPDVQDREKLNKPPAPPGRSPEVDELLQKVKLTRADIEQRKADKSQRELPASPDEPADIKESKKVQKAPEPPGRSPDLNELLDKIEKQPGGKEKLDKARKAGAHIPPGRVGSAGGAVPQFSIARLPGPRVEGPFFDFLAGEEQGTVLKVTRAAPYQNIAGLGYLNVSDFTPWSSNTSSSWGGYYRWAYPNYAPVGGSVDLKPFLSASVSVTTPGWYILNFVASKGKASLRKWDGTAYSVQTQWDNSASANVYESYPAVFNLAAGYHYFYWIPDTGTYFWVTEVSLTKL